MKVKVVALLMATTWSIANSTPAMAWGKTGHRVCGEIAQQYLSPDAQARITAILGVEDLAEASTWPDFMRSSPQAFWQETANPLHYVTIPAGKSYYEAGPPAQGDAITALAQFRRTLQNEHASQSEQQLALRFTVHLIGDLHQPLHAGDGTDRGGNDYSVTFFGRLTNLHSVWDTDLVEDEGLSYTELSTWLRRRLTPGQVAEWQQTDPVIWVTESAGIRAGIYPGEDRDIRWNYVFQHRATVRLRLTQAGIRMAAYLNEVFAKPDRARPTN